MSNNIKRKNFLKSRKKARKDLKKTLKDQLSMFESIPKSCMTCSIAFDKKNKQHALTWRVVVRDKKINLFCPSCVNELVNEHESLEN